MATETQEARLTCPRRMNELGPWPHQEGLDHWRDDRWGSRPDNRWEWPWQPRVCSFCGGVHPDDAIRLRQEGWRVESTDKSYKRYLQPPGGTMGFGGNVYVPPWFPVPPVKVYTQHFDGEQIDLFNICA